MLTETLAEQAAEVVRAAANTDINTIFGSVINENLTDEVIVTVIATGFDKKKNEIPTSAANGYNNVQNARRTAPRDVELIDTFEEEDDDDADDDIPIFLRNRNF